MPCCLRRSTLQLVCAVQARGFASQFTERRMLEATPIAACRLNRLKPPPGSRGMYSVDQTIWRDVESQEMRAIWPDIVRDLTVTDPFLDVPGTMKWIAKMLQYNVSEGTKRRYLALVYAYKNLAPADQLTQKNLRLARILGWCVEMLESCFLVSDDMIDNSETRRHQLCWHKKDNIGINAINDAMILGYLPYELLRRHFRGNPCYLDLLESFQQVSLRTTIGQSSEILASNFGNKPDLDQYTMNLYNEVISHKTAYSMVFPFHLAMYFANIKDPEMLRQAEKILLEIGHFYQVQNDYLDCFGDPEFKTETDIPEGKLSWLIVTALERVTPKQRKMLEECYGEYDSEKVAKVKQLYSDLGMQTLYAMYEEESYNLVNTYIQQISCDLPHDIFLKFRDDIYRTNAQKKVSHAM